MGKILQGLSIILVATTLAFGLGEVPSQSLQWGVLTLAVVFFFSGRLAERYGH